MSIRMQGNIITKEQYTTLSLEERAKYTCSHYSLIKSLIKSPAENDAEIDAIMKMPAGSFIDERQFNIIKQGFSHSFREYDIQYEKSGPMNYIGKKRYIKIEDKDGNVDMSVVASLEQRQKNAQHIAAEQAAKQAVVNVNYKKFASKFLSNMKGGTRTRHRNRRSTRQKHK